MTETEPEINDDEKRLEILREQIEDERFKREHTHSNDTTDYIVESVRIADDRKAEALVVPVIMGEKRRVNKEWVLARQIVKSDEWGHVDG